MTIEPIADLQAALKLAVAELAFEAGRQAKDNPARADHLMAVASNMQETLKRTAGAGACAGQEAGADTRPI
ncbi:hypothetical protein [Streptomyces sp. NPDC056670]|uniref:hypothetical protein n=1 Tax=Streptomyces sp. NPDC056670 TaxID=3345904 RepID=UPI0036B8B282